MGLFQSFFGTAARPSVTVVDNAIAAYTGLSIFRLHPQVRDGGAVAADIPAETSAVGWLPKGDSVFILPLIEAGRSRGGMILPDQAKERSMRGIVLAIGKGLWDADRQRLIPVEVGIGDLVAYGQYAGEEFELEPGFKVVVARNIEMKARKRPGSYVLVEHHLDIGGLGERFVYHESHTFCEHCPAPEVPEAVREEREKLQEGFKAELEQGHDHAAETARDRDSLLPPLKDSSVPGPIDGSLPDASSRAAARTALRELVCAVEHPEFAVITCTRMKDHDGPHRGIDHVNKAEVNWNE